MHIHTISPSDTVYAIAKAYGVSPTKIIENNSLSSPDRLTVGQQLLILTPTKSYTVRGGDTLEKIAKRFGISENTLLRNNPTLLGTDKTYPEEILALKYDTPVHGISILNGYYYNGCPNEKLTFALPYLNYVTVSGAVAAQNGIKELFATKAVADYVRKGGRIPLYRIYDRRENLDTDRDLKDYTDSLASIKAKGFSGITLAAHKAQSSPDFEDFLFKLKKHLIEEGLSLFLEVNANLPIYYTDIPDAQILFYEKCGLDNIPSFRDGEERVLVDFSETGDTSRAFIDISPFAYADGEEIPKADAESEARRLQREIKHDKEKKICYFDSPNHKKDKSKIKRTIYESMENIKAKLDLAGELGYMGISFDIMRVQTSELMMINSLFLCGGNFLPLI